MNPAPETPPTLDEAGALPADTVAAAGNAPGLPRARVAGTARTASGGKRPMSWWRQITASRFLFVSVLVHLLFAGVATVVIVQSVTAKRKLTFTAAPPSPNRSTRAAEHRVQMAQKQKTMSAPAPEKRVTTTAANARIALPQMPVMSSLPTTTTPAKMAGTNGAGLGLTKMGSPGTSGNSGGSGVNTFGFRSNTASNGLIGTFYDLKQTNSLQPITEMAVTIDPGPMQINSPANLAYDKVISQFIKTSMVGGSLSRYFKGPEPLYTKQIFIPTLPAENGPKAFDLQDKVQPKRWIVVYRGTVTPPVDGNYRFVGWADDVLAVRFNGRLVLDGSLCNPTGTRPTAEYHYSKFPGPLYPGESSTVVGGHSYPIDIVIGERPGGFFSAFLLVEKIGENYEKSPQGSPVLPILKFAPQPASNEPADAPETAADTAWSVWKAVAR